MNKTTTDTCHCLIRHADKAKFLVVKHDESWSPPVLMFPSGQIDFKVRQINQGMLDKYGLKTRVLRPLMQLPNYHCIEMELASDQPVRKLQAVWADKAEYLRTRSDPEGVPDPFEIWLNERESGQVPGQRPPFHLPGWFERAEHWIQFKLDQLGMQVVGSVEQFRLGWVDSCLLRVLTSQGAVFFKAGPVHQPAEAALVPAMARHWPDTVFEPLAVDVRHNWMLNLDYLQHDGSKPDVSRLPEFARRMALLQLDSVKTMPEWKGLGCKDYSLDHLQTFCQDPSIHQERLQEGGGGLSAEGWEEFSAVLQRYGSDCQALAAYRLPMTLVHPDFRDENMIALPEGIRLIDWNGTLIAHPFLVLDKIQESSRWFGRDQGADGSLMKISPSLLEEIKQAYLGCFADFGSYKELCQALDLANRLVPIWSILRTLNGLQHLEMKTPDYYNRIVGMQQLARKATRNAQAS